MGNYLISKKPGREVVSFLFSTKECGKRNVMKNVGTRKQFNLIQNDQRSKRRNDRNK